MAVNYKKKKYKSIIRESANSDTKDRIWAHYLDEGSVHLSAKEEEIRVRWAACFSLLVNYHSVQQAVSVICKQFDISEAQAYRDCRNAVELFGDVTKSNKEAYRHILFEFAMKIFQLAATKNDLVEMNKALQSMIKIKGLDKEDPDLPDFGLLQPHVFNISIPDQQLNLLKEFTKSSVINLSDLEDENQND